MIARVICILATAFTIAACGGEGGGGSDSVQTDTQLPTLNDARIVPFETVEAVALRATTDGEVVTFFSSSSTSNPLDSNIRFTVDSEVCPEFDSTTQSVTDTLLKRPLPPSPLRRHRLRDWSLFSYSPSRTLAANVAVSWHNEILLLQEYLVSGYWMCLEGDLNVGSITDGEIGVFVDGPELSNPAQLPTEGQTIYRGRIAGMYTYYYGPLWAPLDPRLVEGLKETGEFSGAIAFKADFAKGTMEGCIGCVENFETTGVTVDSGGRRSTLYTDVSLASMTFAPVRIQKGGTFQSMNLMTTIGDSGLEVSFEVGDNQGILDGQFSSHSTADGDPRLVAGTIHSQWTHPDGSRGVFVGSFFATKVRTK